MPSLHGHGVPSISAPRRVVPDVPLFECAQETPADVRDAIVQHHRVRRFRGGHHKHEAYPNRGRAMQEYPFVQINPADFRNFLVVDVDRDDAELWLMHPSVPEPHWIIQNPENGHAQAGWMIDPVHTGAGAKEHPIRYADAVQASLDKLVGADPAFTRYLVRNPAAHSPAGRVVFGSRLEPYSLGELMRHMQQYRDPFEPGWNAWDPGQDFVPARIAFHRAEEGGRNNAIFYATRAELWRRFDDGFAPTVEASLDFASLLNAALPEPLPPPEVREIAASAVRQVLRGKGRNRGTGIPSQYLSELGRRGGQSKSGAKRDAAAENAAKATQKRRETSAKASGMARTLRALGHSLAEIARTIGRSLRTVQRYLATQAEEAAQACDITQPTGSHSSAAGDSTPAAPPSATASCPSSTRVHRLHSGPSALRRPTPCADAPEPP